MKIKVNNITSQYCQYLYGVLRPHRRILLLLFLIVGVQAYGFEYIYKGVKFECKILNGNMVTITKISPNAKTVYVPAEATDSKTGRIYPVKFINVYSNFYKPRTETLMIEEGVEIIEKRAFAQYIKLKKVSLPSTIRKIGKNAFRNMKYHNGIVYPTARIGELLEASGIDFYSLAGPTKKDTTPGQTEQAAVERERRFPRPQPVSADSLPVIKVVSFSKVENSLGARTNSRLDYSDKLCALVKVTLVGYDADYSGDFIPEPRLNFISYNKEGKDWIWLTERATGFNIYSPDKDFEPKHIEFKIYNQDIPYLESGCLYELNIRIVQESKTENIKHNQ